MIFDWSNPNLRWVLIATALLGIATGTLGSFAFLRGRSLMGDALAHAALPGVCLAFLLGEAAKTAGIYSGSSKSLWLLLLGASVTAFIASRAVSAITRYTRLKEDAAQAIVLTTFFGVGIVLLTIIQHSGSGSQSGLDKFLFGQTAALVGSDVNIMIGIAIVLCFLAALLYKEFKLLCFDPEFGTGLGFSMHKLDSLLMILIVAAVVAGLQAVGVVLISALLITPPAAARFWTDKLGAMIVLSAFIGGISGVLGSVLSALPSAQGLPTGPMIVMAVTLLFFASLLFAPNRGALPRWFRERRNRAYAQSDEARERALTENVV